MQMAKELVDIAEEKHQLTPDQTLYFLREASSMGLRFLVIKPFLMLNLCVMNNRSLEGNEWINCLKN